MSFIKSAQGGVSLTTIKKYNTPIFCFESSTLMTGWWIFSKLKPFVVKWTIRMFQVAIIKPWRGRVGQLFPLVTRISYRVLCWEQLKLKGRPMIILSVLLIEKRTSLFLFATPQTFLLHKLPILTHQQQLWLNFAPFISLCFLILKLVLIGLNLRSVNHDTAMVTIAQHLRPCCSFTNHRSLADHSQI